MEDQIFCDSFVVYTVYIVGYIVYSEVWKVVQCVTGCVAHKQQEKVVYSVTVVWLHLHHINVHIASQFSVIYREMRMSLY